MHSTLDGAAIGAATLVSWRTGVVVALAIVAHDMSDGLNTMNLVTHGEPPLRSDFYFLAADAIVQGIDPQWPVALSSFALLCAFAAVTGYGLHVRLLAQYRGENLNESAAASVLPKDRQLRLGWNLPGFTTPVAAVFEKEVRYLLRSGPMLLTFVMPFFALFVFRFPCSTPNFFSSCCNWI